MERVCGEEAGWSSSRARPSLPSDAGVGRSAWSSETDRHPSSISWTPAATLRARAGCTFRDPARLTGLPAQRSVTTSTMCLGSAAFRGLQGLRATRPGRDHQAVRPSSPTLVCEAQPRPLGSRAALANGAGPLYLSWCRHRPEVMVFCSDLVEVPGRLRWPAIPATGHRPRQLLASAAQQYVQERTAPWCHFGTVTSR